MLRVVGCEQTAGAVSASQHEDGRSRAFMGSGYSLNGDAAAPVERNEDEKKIRHTITFWRNGFTIDDGPLRPHVGTSLPRVLLLYLSPPHMFCLLAVSKCVWAAPSDEGKEPLNTNVCNNLMAHMKNLCVQHRIQNGKHPLIQTYLFGWLLDREKRQACYLWCLHAVELTSARFRQQAPNMKVWDR